VSSYTEQEEAEKLKAWWKEYGNSLIIGVLLGAGLLFGYKYWSQHQEQRLEAASDLYEQMTQGLRQSQADAARQAGQKLVNEYAATPYAGLAALLLARQSFEAGDKAAARTHLQWAVEHAKDPATIHTARLRLARLLLDASEQDAAAALLRVQETGGFEAEYQELRGDLFALQGRRDEARAAYQSALKAAGEASAYSRILTMKLDDLGTEKQP
jgi:predicted negative regulator of RcsB-dependent stress response